jgi:hypothetical protein
MRSLCCDDAVPHNQIQTHIRKMTGTLVSKQRIGRWISAGELRMLKVPCRGGYRYFTRMAWLRDLIEKYSA